MATSKQVQVHGVKCKNLTKLPKELLGMWSMECDSHGMVKFSVLEGEARIWSVETAPKDINGHLMLPNPHTIYLAYQKLKDLTSS